MIAKSLVPKSLFFKLLSISRLWFIIALLSHCRFSNGQNNPINGGGERWQPPQSSWAISAVPLTPSQGQPQGPSTQPAQPVQPSNTLAPEWPDPELEKVVEIPNIMYKFQAKYNYAEALAKSLLFFEAQRSGELPYDKRISWRGNSALNDGEDNGVDLSGGYYDGGGYIKYGFSQAFSITVLSWGMIRYRRTYEVSGQAEYMKDAIKWGTDYFLKCHVADNEFYGQVSDKTSNLKYWGLPESMEYKRRSYKIDENNPGSELAAETAAALAAASIVFYHDNREYSDLLLEHAIKLYDFASIFKRIYHDSIKVAGAAYRSSGFKDELAWAAAWIYRRNGETQFLKEAIKYYNNGKLTHPATQFSWDDKRAGVQMLMAEITGGTKYKNSISRFCNYVLPGGGAKYTPGGLLYQQEWGPLRYAANAAFICALAADLNLNVTYYRSFALKQIDYILGSTGRSFVVGFGVNPPQQVHHISSFCPPLPYQCPRWATGLRNSKILYGALIGGPDHIDMFYNDITNQKQSSVTLDFNAGYQSALAAVLDIHIWGQEKADRPKPDKPGKISKYEDTRNPTNLGGDYDAGVLLLPKVVFKANYAKAITQSLLFYQAQRSGKLSSLNRIPWRSNSALSDGAPDFNFVGGYYDGNDYVKYGYPLAFTVTMLSWSYLENFDAYEKSSQGMYLRGAIRWGADYLLKCYIGQEVLVGQIGDPALDRLLWDRPEYINQTSRTVSYITRDSPGSDIAAETAAALAATSMVFKRDVKYHQELKNKSELLLSFASTGNTDVYTTSIPTAAAKYPSSGFHDEIAWAYLWLYKATNKTKYRTAANTVYNTNGLGNLPDTFSYDVKNAGVQLLLSEITKDNADIANFCNNIVKNGITTPKGLLFIDENMPTRHAAGVALILLQSYKKFKTHPDAKSWRDFGVKQINYLLGKHGQSYVVGYNDKSPLRPYHRASSCPTIPAPCGFTYRDTPAPNSQTLFGALVGGPDKNDNFEDSRINVKQSSVSLDTNAVFQAALAVAYSLELSGDLNSSAQHTTYSIYSFSLTLIIINLLT